MWGGIITEVGFLSNFHVGFNNTKSDILIHLTQWQYWWWFWFSYFWVLYFLLFMRIFRYRVIKFKPRIVTSYRPHGKWGDLIVCLLPVSWCLNIITNSNFILRMIEWQAESSLFTLRVRGKQWYWVYKYEVRILTDILTTPKNIGNNKWVISNPFDLQVADDYLHIHQLRYQNQWLDTYWSSYLDTEMKEVASYSSSSVSTMSPEIFKFSSYFNRTQKILKNPSFITSNENLSVLDFNVIEDNTNSFIQGKDYIQEDEPNKKIKINSVTFLDIPMAYRTKVVQDFLIDGDLFTNPKYYGWAKHGFYKDLEKNIIFSDFTPSYRFGHSDSSESFRYAKRGQSLMTPIRIIKYPLNLLKEHKNDDIIELFRLRFNVESKQIEPKINPHQSQWIFKQKRYKRISSLKTKTRFYTDESGELNKNIKYTYQPYIHKNRIILNDNKNYFTHYQIFKKSKKRNEDIRLPFNKRLLRTKRIVVLPAHVNLTIITNSFDVVHSWFIPGLGLKMDCIPGRSTHHVLHIDHVGFYYGQCAEICGRYHHHMPIRICALPFEHFLVWWHSFGLPKLLKGDMHLKGAALKKYKYMYTSRKYVW